MANRQRGESTLTVQDKSYRLVLDLDAVCHLEQTLSTPEQMVTLPDVIAGISKLSVTYIRAYLWAALRRHHPEVTLLQAGRLIEDAGGIDAVLEQMTAVTASTLPDPQDQGASRPQPARRRRGTGGPTTSTHVASV